jgi:hypothetical protein
MNDFVCKGAGVPKSQMWANFFYRRTQSERSNSLPSLLCPIFKVCGKFFAYFECFAVKSLVVKDLRIRGKSVAVCQSDIFMLFEINVLGKNLWRRRRRKFRFPIALPFFAGGTACRSRPQAPRPRSCVQGRCAIPQWLANLNTKTTKGAKNCFVSFPSVESWFTHKVFRQALRVMTQIYDEQASQIF